MPTAVDPIAPTQLGPVTLRNRVIKAATSEGRSPKGLVTDDLIAFHCAFADGGVGMTTVAYCCVSSEGASAPGQIVMSTRALPGLQKLAESVHQGGAAISAQLGHAGIVAPKKLTKATAVAPSRFVNPTSFAYCREITRPEIAAVIEQFAQAAQIAVDAGFDAVELHFGHLYLPSSFLSPLINRRKDEYGGSIDNRSRLVREIAERVRDTVGNQIAVIAKLNMSDGVRGGIPMEESLQTAKWLEEDGALDALELTAGSSLVNPMYLFRGDAPVKEFAANFKPPLSWGIRMTGHKFFREYPYEEAYLLKAARQFRAELTMPLILLGGITNRETMDLAMAEGFEFVAMGRALLAEPDLLNRIQADRNVKSGCTHCNLCMPTIYSQTHCVVTGMPY